MVADRDTTESTSSAELAALGYKEPDKRSSEILDLYRSGMTLQEIGRIYGVTRERVRQIVKKVIEQVAENESILKGISVDIEVFNDGISKKRREFQESKKIAKRPKVVPKEHRWSKYYVACRRCGTTSIPHVKKGLCEECIGIFRAGRREIIIAKHGSKCDVCGKLRADARVDYGRDLFITKDKRVLCLGCFRADTGKVLGSHKNYEWSRYYPMCKKCGTTVVPHVKKGLCENCCDLYSEEQRELLIREHDNKCDHCHIDRAAAQTKYGRDLYVTKSVRVSVLCRDCFQKSARFRFFKKSAAN